mgnify:CR=1 FL=1
MTKKLIILFISIICMLGITNKNVYAFTYNTQYNSSPGGSYSNFTPGDWKPSSTNTVKNADKLESIGNKVVGVLKVVGSIISVIALIILGIKYIFGSIEERAEYKKTMKPYLIGALMVFAITTLLGIIQDIVGGF